MKKMTERGAGLHTEYVRAKMEAALSVVSMGTTTKMILVHTVTDAAIEAGARNPDLCPVCGSTEDDEETCPHCVWGVPAADAVEAMDHIASVNT